ncbi:metal-dependent transcriptional regulator [Crocinitomicaceae bacterium]|nr:metal-dependent transcriptional regulator [Crocinitomicaceae bacterium]
MLTQSEENYLKAIYTLSEEFGDSVSTNLLADKIETKPSSVTDMVKKLSEKDLISYQKYQGCTLTNEGKKKALLIIRKHRLWEVFLVEKLKFGWEEVHEVAEQLEHIQSVKLTNQLDDFLDNPKIDPHGDSIPDRNGVITLSKKSIPLSELTIGEKALVVGVEDGSLDFFNFLKRYDIGLGTEISIIEKFSFDKSILVEINNKEVSFSSLVSNKIFIQIQS